jgi:glycosyltransferase involved in cell wall biosynthesis
MSSSVHSSAALGKEPTVVGASLGEELVRHVGVPRAKLRTVYASADESFRPVDDVSALAVVRTRYRLPQEPVLLMVVKGQVVGQASGKALTPRKNVALAVQAMACGCPVITATTSACPEVAGDAGILADPDDLDGLADAIYRVSLDDTLVENLRHRRLRRSAGFSWCVSVRTLVAELEAAARHA